MASGGKTVGDAQYMLATEFAEYTQQLNACVLAKDRLDGTLSDLIRATIEDIRHRRRQLPVEERAGFMKKMGMFLTSLYYLSPLGRLFNPDKYKMAWKVFSEIKTQVQTQEGASV